MLFHFKKCFNNFFIIISNEVGKVIFSKSVGSIKLGKKRSDNVIINLCNMATSLSIYSNKIILIRLEGFPRNLSKKIRKLFYSKLLDQNTSVCFLGVIQKISHNGCRKKSK